MTALKKLEYIASNKVDAERFSIDVITEIGDGEHDVLEAISNIRMVKDSLDAILDSDVVKDAAIKELLKYEGSKKQTQFFVLERGSRAKYDFSVCNDQEWYALQEELAIAKKKVSDREAFLKAYKPDMLAIASTQDGDIIIPPAVETTEFIKFGGIKKRKE